MKQPKTLEEFMALPERQPLDREVIEITDENRAELEARARTKLPGSRVTFFTPKLGYAYCAEPDTIMWATNKTAGFSWRLGLDRDGFYRYKTYVGI